MPPRRLAMLAVIGMISAGCAPGDETSRPDPPATDPVDSESLPSGGDIISDPATPPDDENSAEEPAAPPDDEGLGEGGEIAEPSDDTAAGEPSEPDELPVEPFNPDQAPLGSPGDFDDDVIVFEATPRQDDQSAWRWGEDNWAGLIDVNPEGESGFGGDIDRSPIVEALADPSSSDLPFEVFVEARDVATQLARTELEAGGFTGVEIVAAFPTAHPERADVVHVRVVYSFELASNGGGPGTNAYVELLTVGEDGFLVRTR